MRVGNTGKVRGVSDEARWCGGPLLAGGVRREVLGRTNLHGRGGLGGLVILADGAAFLLPPAE